MHSVYKQMVFLAIDGISILLTHDTNMQVTQI
jgi:hypothetical protein